MDVLALFGSPRRKGNSDALMEAVLEPAEKTGKKIERVRISKLTLRPCQGCHWCEGRGECIQKDDMEEVVPKILEARWVVLSVPIYFYNAPGYTKILIDRCQVLWARKYTPPEGKGPVAISAPGRKGFAVAAGATRGKNLFKGLEWTVRYFFDAIDVTYEGVLGVRHLEAAGDAETHPDALSLAREAGERLFLEGSKG
jgi:multimeric flavodoxin WrbA